MNHPSFPRLLIPSFFSFIPSPSPLFAGSVEDRAEKGSTSASLLNQPPALLPSHNALLQSTEWSLPARRQWGEAGWLFVYGCCSLSTRLKTFLSYCLMSCLPLLPPGRISHFVSTKSLKVTLGRWVELLHLREWWMTDPAVYSSCIPHNKSCPQSPSISDEAISWSNFSPFGNNGSFIHVVIQLDPLTLLYSFMSFPGRWVCSAYWAPHLKQSSTHIKTWAARRFSL